MQGCRSPTHIALAHLDLLLLCLGGKKILVTKADDKDISHYSLGYLFYIIFLDALYCTVFVT